MNEIYSRKKTPKSDAKDRLERDDAALGVGLNLAASHVSLIYADHGDDGQDKKLKQLQFNFDKIESPELSLDPAEKGHFFYAEAACVDSENLAGFNAYLMTVARNDALLTYGVDWKDYGGLFDASGVYHPPETPVGLTCSSFLAEVFHGYSMTLFQMHTWIENMPHDLSWRDEWRQKKLAELAKGRGRLTAEQIDEIWKVDPLIRLRPTQVAAAVASPPLPAKLGQPVGLDSEQAEALAVTLMKNFDAASAVI